MFVYFLVFFLMFLKFFIMFGLADEHSSSELPCSDDWEYIILMDTISIHIPSYQYPLISIDIQIRMLSRHKWGSRDRRDSARIAVSARHIFHWPRMIGEIQRGQTWRHIMYVASSFDGVLCFVWFCLCVLLQCFKNAGTYWT